LKNNYLYQGGYSELDEDIGWNDFALRNYDAQIGRWVQQDPYQEFATPYVGMCGDPVNLTDPSGGSVLGLTKAGLVLVTTVGGAIIGAFVDAITGNDSGKGYWLGASIGLAAGLGSLIEKITFSMGIATANTAVTIINSSTSTSSVNASLNGPNLPDKEIPVSGEFPDIEKEVLDLARNDMYKTAFQRIVEELNKIYGVTDFYMTEVIRDATGHTTNSEYKQPRVVFGGLILDLLMYR
jgi:RHS repeat-associated protein